MFRMPLQAGDRGVSRVDNVVGSVATVGTFNVLVMRRLARLRVPVAGFADTFDLIKCHPTNLMGFIIEFVAFKIIASYRNHS
jgi:hypothetical protein